MRSPNNHERMDKDVKRTLRNLPSVDELLRSPRMSEPLAQFGRPAVTAAIREALAAARQAAGEALGPDQLIAAALASLAARAKPALRPVFNLTGTVLVRRRINPAHAVPSQFLKICADRSSTSREHTSHFHVVDGQRPALALRLHA